MTEREPLDELRDAWRALQAPALDPGPDPALAWMRAAWDALEPPPARVPRRRAPRPLARLLRTAAAAALLAGALAGSLRWWSGARPAHELRADALAALEPAPRALDATFHDDGSIELRSGVVRLVLFPERDGSGTNLPETER